MTALIVIMVSRSWRRQFFVDVIVTGATAAAAPAEKAEGSIEETLEDRDDRNAQEEGHQTPDLGQELKAMLREVVDALVL